MVSSSRTGPSPGSPKPGELDSCPITGLPITRKPEWTDQTFGTDYYSITFSVIGSHIILSQASGYTHLCAFKEYVALLERVVGSSIAQGEKYILIEDYTRHTGASNRAKSHFIDYHRHNDRLLGMIFCTRAAFFKIIIKMGRSVVLPGFPVEIADSYEPAIRLALQWQQRHAESPPKRIDADSSAASHGITTTAEATPGICAVTGLPITAPAEWAGIDLGEGYSVSFRLIGEMILQTLPVGGSGKNGMRRLFEERARFLTSMGLSEGSYVEIKDYRAVPGTVSKEGRLQFIEGMVKERDEGRLLGYWGYGASPFVRWGIAVGKRLQRTTFPLVIVDRYETAVTGAANALKGADALARLDGIATKKRAPIVQRGGRSPRRDWTIELDGISCTYRLVGDDILLYTAKGDLKPDDVEKLFEFYERVVTESKLAERGQFYQIADWSELGESSLRARRLFIERFRQSSQKYQCRLYVVFGLSGLLQTIVALMRHFFPVRLIVARSFEDAVGIIEKQRASGAAAGAREAENDEGRSIEELLRFMGEINWGTEGADSLEHDIPPSHPFTPLFEAVSLIKQDFDILLKEKDNAERVIAKQNRFNRLRAEIWKLAAQQAVDEDALIQKLLDEIGPVFNVSRACFLRFRGADLICQMEWCNEGIKPTRGNKEPAFLIEHFAGRELVSITPETALEMVPGPLRAIARPVIATLAKIEDLESVSLLAYTLEGKTRGWFSFDICRSQKDKPTMTEEMAGIAREVVSIVSNSVMRRRAELQLEESLSGMERTVLERTAELKTAVAIAEMASSAKGTFLANMSHEIRTPLNGIMGFAQIIAKSPDVDRREREQAEQIAAECRKLLELINLVLDLAKIEAGKMEIEARAFSLRALLGDLTSAFNAGAAEKSIGFSVVIQEEVPDGLIGDGLRLRQVLTNLIGNAIKFTREGSVSVTAGISEENGNQVRLIFWVIDTGIGISPEKLGLIFESFTQADGATTREYGGSGLGTTICKQLIELMGGEIGVESATGKGSAFWFTVPFEKGSLATAAECAPETEQPPASFRNARVLVVEDYPTNQAIARYLIESAGGVVAVAENGLVALEMFKERDFDIILMDVQMPRMDGYEATREIRKLPRGATIPIVGMTANVFEKDRQACLAAGMNDFIPKPFELRQFHDVVAHWLAPASAAGEAPARGTADGAAPVREGRERGVPIDVEAYVERMGGNREIAETIIKGFIELLPGQLRNIEAALENGDIKTVDREAHSLKGGASNVFANDLMLAAKELEMHAKSGSLDKARELLERIRREYERLSECGGGFKT